VKTLILTVVAAVILTGGVAYGQDFTGTWQGTLSAGKELRIVFKVSGEPAALKAVMHSLDQGGQPIGVSTVTAQGQALKMSVQPIDGTFDGRLSGDGRTIVGTWSQGGGSLPLTLTKATADTAWALPAPPTPMAANAPLVFEVATIKPSRPDTPGKLFTVKGREVLTINTTLNDIISFAYDMHPRQISGGAPWMGTDKYDITAKPEGAGVPSMQQLKALFRSLLADRFRLASHQERRELSVYALLVAKEGSKLTRSQADPNGLPGLGFRRPGQLGVVNATMRDFAGTMQGAVLDRPVVDQTGLIGKFDFTLNWTPDESQFATMGIRVPPPTNDAAAPPGLFTAIQEQLGLRLEPAKAPADVLVIDRVEKPSEN
jgi:uncharacterized protein (TIGR03435 family)